MKKMKKNKGFTLIELLVVIAIIGILASIVLVSLSGARNKAKDAKIKSDLGQVRSISEMINSDAGNYSFVCGSATTLNTAHTTYGGQLTNINADILGAGGAITCNAAANAYCVSSTLPGGGNHCLDSAGKISATYCNTTPACN